MGRKTGNPVGRPKGSKTKRSVGRPKGQAAVIKEYQERMYRSPKSKAVLESIYDAALDNDHKNQAAAWKLVIDRLLPLSHFEKDKLNSGRGSIEININTSDSKVEGKVVDEPVDVEFTEVERPDDN